MYKLFIVIVLSISGCSHYKFNATMCDQIASDPHATVPQECRAYSEDEADKAFHNTKHTFKDSNDTVEFRPEDR